MKQLPLFLLPLVALLLSISISASASITLSPLMNDYAVLQRDEPTPIWGWSSPGNELSIRLGNLTQQVVSDKEGYWRAVFPSRGAGTQTQLTVRSGEEIITVDHLVYGDVWVCSGQSNMEWQVRDSDSSAQTIASANNPLIRHFKVPRSWAIKESKTIAGGRWQPAIPEYVGDFSAVAYYFADVVNQSTEVPIGLIGSNWGGANIESWMSPKALGEKPSISQERIQDIAKGFEAENQRVRKYLQQWPDALAEDYSQATAQWQAINLDVSDWKTLNVPGVWEKQGLINVDGVIWYRKEFILTDQDLSKTAELGLGRIDDNDQTWLNGQLIGTTNAYNTVRRYTVPTGVLREGKNVVAIRVEDTGGGGGIYSDPKLIYLKWHDGTELTLSGKWSYKADKVTLTNQSGMNYVPTALYNKMLHPLFKTPIKGVLWYQGESNAGNVEQAQRYEDQFQNLITGWREGWQQPELPFYWVQLASYDTGYDTEYDSPWAELRASQSAALKLPHTGQAITIDVGDSKDIHPRDKRSVAQRLAAIALNKTYGQKEVVFRGPHIKELKYSPNKIILTFSGSKDLTTQDQLAPNGFELVDDEQKVFTVEGKLKGQSVVINVPNHKNFKEIRYAWRDDPKQANLQDKSGLPAEPFRRLISGD